MSPLRRKSSELADWQASQEERVLLQTHVTPDVGMKFDALARSSGHKRASYLRHLVELHVKALTPQLLRALKRAQPRERKPSKRKAPR